MQGITYAVAQSIESGRLQHITHFLRPHDEVIFITPEQASDVVGSHAAIMQKALNDWVFVVFPYEDIPSVVEQAVHEVALDSQPCIYSIRVQLPHSAGSDVIAQFEPRLLHRDADVTKVLPLSALELKTAAMLKADMTSAVLHRLSPLISQIERGEESFTIWKNAGILQFCLRNYNLAVGALQKAHLRATREQMKETGQLLLRAHYLHGNYSQATELARTLKKLNAETQESLYYLALVNLKQKNYGKSLAAIDACLEMQPIRSLASDVSITTSRIRTFRALLLSEMGVTQQAIDELVNVDAEQLGEPIARYTMASILSKLDRGQTALNYLEPVMRDPEFGARACQLAAVIFFRSGDYDSSTQFYRLAWSQGLNDTEMAQRWISACEHLGSPERLNEAIQTCSSISEIAQSFIQQFDSSQQSAVSRLTHAIHENPQSATSYFTLGEILVSSGNTLDGIHLLEAGLKIESERPDVWHRVAQGYSTLGMSSEAHRAMIQFEKLSSSRV